MAEYIERGPLIEICENQSHADIDDILSVEVADVAPVVRCRECIHWENWGACAHPENGWDAFLMNPDDFCNRGERSTDNSTKK